MIRRSKSGIGGATTTVLIVTILAVTGFSSFYLLSSPAARQSDSPANQSENNTCASATPVANYSYSSPPPHKEVLLLQPNSTVQICVTYDTNWTSAAEFETYKSRWFSSGKLNIPFVIGNDIAIPSNYTTQIMTRSNNATAGSSSSSVTSVTWTTGTAESFKSMSGSFSAQVLPNGISLTFNMTRFTILYTIKPLSNSTGFYSEFGPAPGLLVSVGHSATSVNSSDFPFAGVVRPGGPPFLYRATGVAVIGATVESLSIPGIVP